MNTSLYTSDLFDITFRIQNNGSFTTAQNYVGIRISPYNNYNTSQMTSLGYISLEQLAPFQISNITEYKLPLPYTISSGTYYVYIVADNFGTISETNEGNNIGLLSGTISATKDFWQKTRQNIPYPILFVHGWIGDNTAWSSFGDSVLNRQYGWSDGGILDFCLNYDADVTTGELYADFHNFILPQYNKVGDYYRINFDINWTGDWWTYEGSNNDIDQSNQSAIIKQGYAISQAINYILNLTGKDKVILVGHSMGGLACREYIQFWNPQNRVAKLATIGTPNQGSNSTALGFYSNNLDEKSEAVRDLRRSYFNSGNDGVYLFGGWETNSWIQNSLIWYYNNVDVNCNGVTGEYVSGLDYENYVDINYSCVIGKGDNCATGSSINGDGIVEDWSANLYNGFLNNAPSYVDSFIVWSPEDYFCPNNDFHRNLEKYDITTYGIYNGEFLMKALDEPDLFDAVGYGHAYEIDFNTLYYGNIIKKNNDPFNSGGIDYDDYKFVVTTTSNLTFNIYNINIANMEVQIYNSSQNPYSTIVTNNGQGNISFMLPNTPAGIYYLEIRGVANASPSTWYRTYGFQITDPNSPTSISGQEIYFVDVNVFPNPSIGQFNIDILSNKEESFSIEIYNSIGEKIFEEKEVLKGNHKINLENFSNGIYVARVIRGDKTITKNIVISK